LLSIVMSGAGVRRADPQRSTKLAEAVLGVLGLTTQDLDKLLIAAIQPTQE
jgi:hypothetical protein